MLELYPERRDTSPELLASGLRLGDRAPAERPYLALNMVSTLDGKATIEWRTKGLSTELDRRLFHQLRTQVDAVMIGAGTARVERYGRIAKSEELRAKRMSEGLAPEPLAIIASGRLDLPADLPLLQEPEQEVVIATGSDAVLRGTAARIEYLRTGDDLPLLMATLREERGVRSILCEGGPTLLRELVEQIARAHGGERVRHRHAEVVVAMHAPHRLVGIGHLLADLADQLAELLRHRVPHRVRDVDGGGARVNHCLQHSHATIGTGEQ